ncbi:hypothetical protein PsYK624_118220 [Phanerochaete sordida]|uniref:Uncharacterized protein n=1 Tax=Phanerochaete sordida TaxID=48140 RepID=A0A9P3LHK6_9APHY|nr:hypothetical protein PsYK624_118220 [Phanerochaete sordida]
MHYFGVAADVMHQIRIIRRRALANTALHGADSEMALAHLFTAPLLFDAYICDGRGDEMRTAATAPNRDEINDACTLMQRILDINFTGSYTLAKCKTQARDLKDKWERQLMQMSDVRQSVTVDIDEFSYVLEK